MAGFGISGGNVGSSQHINTAQAEMEKVTSTSWWRTRAQVEGDDQLQKQSAKSLSFKASRLRSKLRWMYTKCGKVSFRRVLASLFHSSDSTPTSPGPLKVTPVRTASESLLRPSTGLTPSMSVDILFPPVFTFSGPVLQPSSTKATPSTSRASTNPYPRPQKNHTHWDCLTEDFPTLGSPDGSNDKSHEIIFEPFHDPLSRSLSETAPSSEGSLDNHGVLQSLEQSSDSRSEPRHFLAQQADIYRSAGRSYNHTRLASESSEVYLSPEDNSSKRLSLLEPDDPCPTRASWLPLELLHQIFYYLHPVDFNAARHICQRWMLASLDCRVLCTMIRRAGWSSLVRNLPTDEGDDLGDVSLELRLSGDLARSCALGPNWTGSGVHFYYEGSTQLIQPYPPKCALMETCDVDFTGLSSGAQETTRNRASGLIFTVSACGRFLMVGENNMIYVYQLGPGHDIDLVVRIACPRRVLGVSMDTTCGRYAVAAFLDGRLGMVCDLQLYRSSTSNTPEEICDDFSRHGAHCPIPHDRDSSEESLRGNNSRSSSPLALISAEDSSARKRTISVAANEIPPTENQEIYQVTAQRKGKTEFQSDTSRRSYRSSHQPVCPTLMPNKRTIYEDLCYPDDPPRTVAICPSRSCAAFGCNAGIQLHWIDVVTKRQEDRFFPLSATTDVLYFLPPRIGADATPSVTAGVTDLQSDPQARRLRLIGSAVAPHPDTVLGRTELRRRMFGATDMRFGCQPKHRRDGQCLFSNRESSSDNSISNQKQFHERLQQDWSLAELEGSVKQKIRGGSHSFRHHHISDHDVSIADLWQKWASRRRQDKKSFTPDFDHYRAISLSDGYHILFTDPPTGLLCLGCDAPFERPMKLTRKMILEPPFSQGRMASMEQIWQKSKESKMDKGKGRKKRTSTSELLTRSEDEGSIGHNSRDDNDVVLFPTVYAAGTNLQNGVFIVAGYEEDLVLYTIPPDIFAVSQKELQPTQGSHNEAGGNWLYESVDSDSSASQPAAAKSPSHLRTGNLSENENDMEWQEYWPDTVSWSMAATFAGVNRADPRSAPDGPGFFNSPPLTRPTKPGIWPVKIRGTWLGKVPTLVDIAVRNENSELAVWAFGANGHAYAFEIDSVRVERDGHVRLKRKLALRTGEIREVDREKMPWHVRQSDVADSAGFDGCSTDILTWLRKTGRTTTQRSSPTLGRSCEQLEDSDSPEDACLSRGYRIEATDLTGNTSSRARSASMSTLVPGSSASNDVSEQSYPIRPDHFQCSRSPRTSRGASSEFPRIEAASSGSHILPSHLHQLPFSLHPAHPQPPPPISIDSLTRSTAQNSPLLSNTHSVRRAYPRAWRSTDLDEVPYDFLSSYHHQYSRGRLASFRPDTPPACALNPHNPFATPGTVGTGFRSTSVRLNQPDDEEERK
ncbi:MAG: hypothetical protein Q9157_001069 [Trypethelium eluteriae]